jgi:hypothetical protein
MANNREDRPPPQDGLDKERTEAGRIRMPELSLLEEQMRVLAQKGKFKIDLAKTQIKSLELRVRPTERLENLEQTWLWLLCKMWTTVKGEEKRSATSLSIKTARSYLLSQDHRDMV